VFDKSRRAQAAQRSADRLRVEQAATRLSTLFPDLATLSFDVVDIAGASSTRYKKHIVVASAPALFVLTCTDERCEGGGHDLTNEVLHVLRQRRTALTGEHTCEGTAGTALCAHRLTYDLHASFR
jgi:hypothetical protein